MVMSGRSVNLTTLFLGRLKPKRLTSAHSLASNCQLLFLNYDEPYSLGLHCLQQFVPFKLSTVRVHVMRLFALCSYLKFEILFFSHVYLNILQKFTIWHSAYIYFEHDKSLQHSLPLLSVCLLVCLLFFFFFKSLVQISQHGTTASLLKDVFFTRILLGAFFFFLNKHSILHFISHFTKHDYLISCFSFVFVCFLLFGLYGPSRLFHLF